MKKNLANIAPATLPLFLAAWLFTQAGAQGPGSSGPPANQTKGGSTKLQGGPGQVPGKLPTPPKPAWQEFKLNPKTTMFLDFTDSNPDMIISIFSRTSGITILKDPTFKIPLTVTSARAVGLNEAFEIFNTVLGMNGYELKKQGNLMVVSRKSQPQPPMNFAPPPAPVPVIKTYPLVNANAAQVARVINEIFAPAAGAGGGGGSPQLPPGISFGPGGPPIQVGGPGGGGGGGKSTVHASSEDYSNAVIVSAMPKEQTDIAALIQDLDKTTKQPLESVLFHLKYVPAEEVLTAIEDVLTANVPMGRGANNKKDNSNSSFFFGFNPFGNNNQHSAGGQSATAVKQTNSVIVNATKENIELVRKLIENLDQPSNFIGTTSVIRLENAKASDVADLLNKVFTQKANPNDNSPFFFFSDFGSNNNNKKDQTIDRDENGQIVNVKDIIGKVNIIADPNTNSLVIVTQPSNMPMIRSVIDKLDQVAEQVMIETIIVEANLDKTTKLGVEWSFLQNNIFHNPNASNSGKLGFGLQNATPALEGLNYTITGGAYRAFLNALQTDTRFKVLDTPRIFTSNNVKAEINVSQKVPYITSQEAGALGNLISNYQFQDVGVVLTVTPRITSNGQVTMDVVQSADDLQGFTTFNAPIINHRQASTTVSVNDGETIVLGGIIRHTLTQTEKKVPFLGDIPLIGNLFKSSSKTDGQTELMVFLTPHVVRSASEAKKLKDSQTKDLSKPSQDSVKKNLPPPGGGG